MVPRNDGSEEVGQTRTRPSHAQARFLVDEAFESLYGGSAGGGKSDALLMAAAQYMDVPGYAAIILRRTFTDLSQPDAIMARSHAWWDPGGLAPAAGKLHWDDGQHTWTNPDTGAQLVFGYLEHKNSHFRYKSAAFQFVGIDELTEFHEFQYTYMGSRIRKPPTGPLAQVPLRLRGASNPDGVGHDWVKKRFIPVRLPDGTLRHPTNPETGERRTFHPARLRDNPGIEPESYIRSLGIQDPITKRQLLDGDWDVRPEGGKFKRHLWRMVEDWPRESRLVRYWDLAATEPGFTSSTPDYTSGTLYAMDRRRQFYVVHVDFDQLDPAERDSFIRSVAFQDRKAYGNVSIYFEREPGSGGKHQTDYMIRELLPGFEVYEDVITGRGSKAVRAGPLYSALIAGNVHMVEDDRDPEPWNDWVLGCFEAFEVQGSAWPDDPVDSTSGAHEKITLEGGTDVDYAGLVLPELGKAAPFGHRS